MTHAPAAAAAPRAEARDQARTLADEAANAFAAGKYAEADQLLGTAFQFYPAPTIALLHARTLLRLRRLLDARDAYERAMGATLAPDSPAAFAQAIAQAKEEHRALSPRIPRIRIELSRGVSPASLRRVELNGQALAATSIGELLPVEPGRHFIRAEASDGSSATQSLQLEERQTVRVVVDFPISRSSSNTAWALGSLSFGGASLVAGIATGIVAMQARASANQDCASKSCVEGSEGARHVERFRVYRTLSTIGYGVGAVGLGVGTYLLIRLPSESPVVKLTVSSQPGAIALGGVF